MEAKSDKTEYDQVREDLRKLQEDLSTLAKSVADGQKGNISHLRDEIRRESLAAFDQVKQRGDEALTRARDASGQAVESVEHKIEERPFLSIVLMFLAGVLVGRFFGSLIMPDSDWLQGALRKAIAAFLGFMLGFVLLVALLLTGFYLLVNAATVALTPLLGGAGALAVTGLSCLLLLSFFFYRMTRPLPSTQSDGSGGGQSNASPIASVKRLIQKNPLEAALAAFALGLAEQKDPRMKSLLMQGGMALAKEAGRQQENGDAESAVSEAANDAADS